MLKTRYDLVVDASVAVGASEKSTDKRHRDCAAFLNTMQHVGHRIVMTRAIKTEWKEHPNNFAIEWLQRMISKNRYKNINVPHELKLEQIINDAIADEPIRNLVQKDRHLLEAALASDKRVASTDKKVRSHLRIHINQLGDVGSISWVDPSVEEEQATQWLSNGAPLEPKRLLNYVEA